MDNLFTFMIWGISCILSGFCVSNEMIICMQSGERPRAKAIQRAIPNTQAFKGPIASKRSFS